VGLGFYEFRLVAVAANVAVECKLESRFVTIINIVSGEWLQCSSSFERLATFYTFLRAEYLFCLALLVGADDHQTGTAAATALIKECGHLAAGAGDP
jgi:hypothetical protein